eukprot:4345621-Prorocentrum_lima.AAC.1
MKEADNTRRRDLIRLPPAFQGTPYDMDVILGWKIYGGELIQHGRYIEAHVFHVALKSITCAAGDGVPDI